MGHEFIGVVVAVGADVTRVSVGDRVCSPFTTCCGACFYCTRGMTARCERGELFGWRDEGGCGGLHGAQAEYVRVPLADSTLLAVPEGLDDVEALLLGDVFATGYFAAERGLSGLAERVDAAADASAAVVAVVGCGPVGLMAAVGARDLGAARVFAVDAVPERLALATSFGAEAVHRDAALNAIRAATGGRGADVVVEAVGAPAALELALALVRPGGAVSSCGCHSACAVRVPELYNKNLTLRSGRCSARAYMERLAPVLRRSNVRAIATHRLPLADGAAAYALFDAKADGCVKVVFEVWDGGV
jgi:threonine dehydrogenase-like Zn-dependent dehydrogenase